jgi:hypothetical protein
MSEVSFTQSFFVFFQLDYFGIASTAHVLLTGSYMKLTKNKEEMYFPSGSLKRCVKTLSPLLALA